MEPYDADAAATNQEPAHLDADDLDDVTQKVRFTGPGAKAAKSTIEPKTSVEVLGRKRR
jgi:hypothetical protein